MPDRRVQAAIDHWAPRFIAMGVLDAGSHRAATKRSIAARETFVVKSGAGDEREGRELARRLSLRGVAGEVLQPALFVTGRLDRIVPWQETKRAAREVPRGEFVLFQDGSHVCSNIPYRYRPLVADWMAEQLASVR